MLNTIYDLTTVDLVVYMFFCILVFVWLQKKRSSNIKTTVLLIFDCLCVATSWLMFIIVTLFFINISDVEIIPQSTGSVYEVIAETDEIGNYGNCFVLKEEYYTSANGVVCCAVYTEADKELTVDDFVVPENFCDFIEVLRDEAAENKYNVLFNGFKVENGDYVIKIRHTACCFVIHITDVLSDRITMSCTYSDAEIKAGDTISLLLEYQGLDVTNSTAQMQYNNNLVLLRNCVGKVTGIQRENNSVCVTIENIGVLDKNKETTVEIAAGTMVDSIGMMVNGVVIDLKIQEN